METNTILKYKKAVDDEGRNVLILDPIPEKACCFDCVYCPAGRTVHHEEKIHDFGHKTPSVRNEILNMICESEPEIVLIEPNGEAFFDDAIDFIIDAVHATGTPVQILTSGYLLNKHPYRETANRCEEIAAELRHIRNEQLLKYQRPLAGITLSGYIENIVAFRNQYPGRFLLEAALFKNINDSDEDLRALKEIIYRIRPDHVKVVEFTYPEKIYNAFGVGQERIEYAYRYFNS